MLVRGDPDVGRGEGVPPGGFDPSRTSTSESAASVLARPMDPCPHAVPTQRDSSSSVHRTAFAGKEITAARRERPVLQVIDQQPGAALTGSAMIGEETLAMRRGDDRLSTILRAFVCTVGTLVTVGVLLMVPTGSVLAVPTCDEIHVGMCVNHGQCSDPEIIWYGCQNGIRTFRCHWTTGNCWSMPHVCTGCSSGGGCFLKGTLVTMADGSTRPIELIRQGDQVLAYDESAAMMKPSEVVQAYSPHTVSQYIVLNEWIRLTPTQPVLSKGKWVEASQLQVGDALTGMDGSSVHIFAVRKVDEEVTVYNLAIGLGTYVAYGIIVHNKPIPYEIVPCEGCTED
jgi:hypothetical protein